MTRKEFFTSGELAKMCNVSHTTIFRAIQDGRLKAATTPGGHFRLQRADVEEFLKRNNYPLSLLAGGGGRVLIVEDDPLQLRFFKRALQSEPGLEVEGAAS